MTDISVSENGHFAEVVKGMRMAEVALRLEGEARDGVIAPMLGEGGEMRYELTAVDRDGADHCWVATGHVSDDGRRVIIDSWEIELPVCVDVPDVATYAALGEPTSLEALRDALNRLAADGSENDAERYDERGIALDALPTYGVERPEPCDTLGVYSWDDARELCAGGSGDTTWGLWERT